MATVIKATDHDAAIRPAAFNLEDLARRANEHLASVKDQAARVVSRAEEEADTIRKRAEAEGLQRGLAEAERIVAEKLAESLASLLSALGAAVGQIGDARQAFVAQWERNVVHLASAMAARVIRREVQRQPDVAVSLVREALELASASPEVRVRMHPDDLATLQPQLALVTAELTPLAEPQWIGDERIGRGGCRVETRFGSIDQQFETQLARLGEELT